MSFLSSSSFFRLVKDVRFRPQTGCASLKAARKISSGVCLRNTAYDQQYKAKQTSRLTPTMIILGITPILTFALGTWQIQRLKWKINLIDDLQEKLQRPPLDLPDHVNLDVLEDFTFHKVRVKGHWDHSHSVLIGPRVYDGKKGVNVITPLVRTGGSTVLVDRGFILDEYANTEFWRKQSSSEEIEINGMLRTSQKRNKFTPDNHPERGEWYWVDVDALAEYAGGEAAGVQPVFIEAIFDGNPGVAAVKMKEGIPVGRPPTVEVRNAHAAYVATWYSLSAFTACMFVYLLRKRARAPAAKMPRK